MTIQKVFFVVHFDVLIEHDVTTLRTNWLSEEQVDDVLNTTQLGLVLKRNDNEDGSTYFYGDVDLTDQESYFNLLRGFPTLSTISAQFDGKFVEPIKNDWSSIRTWMLELRRRIMPAEGRWGGYTEAPVTISLGEMELIENDFESTYFNLCSRDAILGFLSNIQKSASINPAVREFVDYFAPEIKRFQENDVSKFLSFWFATELLLTQKELRVVEVGESYKTLIPLYSVDEFDWVRPQQVNMFLEGERAWAANKVFWYTPAPGNPFSEGSDPAWDYSLVPDLEKRVGLTNTTFTKIRFAVTLNSLRTFIEEYGAEEAFAFKLGDFYEKYSVEIEELTDLMRESFDWDDLIDLDGEEAKLIENLNLPANAHTIWEEYLQAILRSDGLSSQEQNETSHVVVVSTEADFVTNLTRSNSPDDVVAKIGIDYCNSVLIPNGRYAEAYCVLQVINRNSLANLVPSVALEMARVCRTNLEGQGYTVLEPESFEVLPQGDNPWNYSRTKQTIVEINVWSGLRNSNLSQNIANISRPVSLGAEFEAIFSVLNGVKEGITEEIIDIFRPGLEGQGDVDSIFETGRWLFGYYIHKLIWSGK